MPTARELVTAAVKKIGAIAQGEALSAPEMADGLAELNRMLSTWSTNGLTIPSTVREVFALVGGTAAYTIGPAGDFNTTRPREIFQAMLLSNSAETPIDQIGIDEWALISVKNTQGVPSRMLSDNASPLATLTFWPVPASAMSVVLYSKKAFTQFADANTSATFPDGYDDAIIYNLAERLCDDYSRPVPATVAAGASKYLANIKRANPRDVKMSNDAFGVANPAAFNIVTGEGG